MPRGHESDVHNNEENHNGPHTFFSRLRHLPRALGPSLRRDGTRRIRPAVRLGVARQIGRSQYRAGRVAAELRKMLEDPRYEARAAEAGRWVRSEDGVAAACDAIEQQAVSVRAGYFTV